MRLRQIAFAAHDLDDIRGTHLHPHQLGGPLLSVDTPTPPAADDSKLRFVT
jgi:hypothetical protein